MDGAAHLHFPSDVDWPLDAGVGHGGHAAWLAKGERAIAHHADGVHLPNASALDVDADRTVREQAMNLILKVASAPVRRLESSFDQRSVDDVEPRTSRGVGRLARDLGDESYLSRHLRLAFVQAAAVREQLSHRRGRHRR